MKGKKVKGSFTVELAIIFPIIMLVVLGMMHLSISHYQNICVSVSAMQAAARGAAYWDVLGGSGAVWDFQANVESSAGNIRNVDYTHHDPYRYLLDTNQANKTTNIASYADWLMGSYLKENGAGKAAVKKDGNILKKYVSVTVEKKELNPMRTILRNLGIHVPNDKSITASAPLNTPTEFIRNASFLYDIAKNLIKTGE